jgi:hypothetical protein
MSRDESFFAHCRTCLDTGARYRGHDVRILPDGVQLVIVCRSCGRTVARAHVTQPSLPSCALCGEGKAHEH